MNSREIASFLQTILYFLLFLHDPPLPRASFVKIRPYLERVFSLSLSGCLKVLFSRNIPFSLHYNFRTREKYKRAGRREKCETLSPYNVRVYTHTTHARKSGRYAEYLFHGRINGEIICPHPSSPLPHRGTVSNHKPLNSVSCPSRFPGRIH